MQLPASLVIGELALEGEIRDVSRGGVQFVCGVAPQLGERGRLERPRSLGTGAVRVARATRQPDGKVALGLSFEGEGPFPGLAGLAAGGEDL